MTTPDGSEEWLDPIFDAVVSDVQASGYFDRVNLHEPKRKPGHGLTAAVWVQAISPLPLASGLAATSGRIVFMVRGFANMLKEPQDMIDPNLTKVMSHLVRRYHDNFDFDLHPTVRNVDLLGQFGIPLAVISGYEEIDTTVFRIMDLTVPVICNDVWPQVQ